MPALQRAARLQQKANVPASSWEEIDAAYHRFKALAMPVERENTAERDQFHEAIGKLLFLLVGISRTKAVNPEDALREACERFQLKFYSAAS
ncbi:MAG: hypothetical protein ACREOO_16990 [bacterium]